MRRRRTGKSTTGVSLFPFLAVLVCTMGALIVLLVMVVQQARVQATEVARRREREAPERRKRLEQLREEYAWRRDVLETQRREMLQELENKRLELSHLEEHIRSLEERWRALQQQAQALAAAGENDATELGALRDELARWAERIRLAEQRLEQARHEAARRPRSYALVPYEGPNGTRRRPIYIECLKDRIVVQPEGITLTEDDFRGPLGPGNPLDAALRAVREYWMRYGGADPDQEPYPLLVVRPDGAEAFAAARAAMRSWDDQFGYELLGDDIHLAYPEPDPALAKLLRQAVAEARQRQELLASMMPSRYGGGPRGFRVSRQGELVPVDGRGQPVGPAAQHRPAGPGEGGGPSTASARAGNEASGRAARSPGAASPAAASGRSGGGPPPGLDSLAASRGPNWALQGKGDGLIAITRPIQVVCRADQLIILPERGDAQPAQVVPLNGPTRAAVEPLVAKVWEHVERWGLAVAGGYWKPVLHVRVAPGGERRFAELAALLEDSGLEVERKWR